MPIALEVKCELMLAVRVRGALALHNKYTVQFFEQGCWSMAVQVLQNPVIGQDLHLIVGKDHGKEGAAFALSLPRLKCASCRSAAVMPIRNIKKRNVRELLHNFMNCFLGFNHPTAVAHAI